MVLIYDKLMRDPRVVRLSDRAFRVWIEGVRLCGQLGREIVSMSELYKALNEAIQHRPRDDLERTKDILDELEDADLVTRQIDGQVQFRARLDLWAFEDEVPPEHIVGGSF